MRIYESQNKFACQSIDGDESFTVVALCNEGEAGIVRFMLMASQYDRVCVVGLEPDDYKVFFETLRLAKNDVRNERSASRINIDGKAIVFAYTNRGEPYRQGLSIHIGTPRDVFDPAPFSIDLDKHDIDKLLKWQEIAMKPPAPPEPQQDSLTKYGM